MQPALQTNLRLELADQYIRFTNKNVFLTGKAGTGKTTFLKNLKFNCPKRSVIVAPTGVAAINAGGVTMHSFFQLPFGPFIPEEDANNKVERRFNTEKIKAIKAVDLLIIDEISMVRADMLDAVDEVLRRFRNRNKPFGGVQLLMIGDLHQLSPVIKDEEWHLLKPYYSSVYFFESRALKSSDFLTIELTHIFRQADEIFINLLNKIRDKKLDAEGVKLLNTRYNPDFEPINGEEYITLTTHNHSAQTINNQKLKELKGKIYTYTADVQNDFPEHMFPNDQELELKIGAQIMFVKNDSSREKRYFNGKLGVITGLENQKIQVRCNDDKSNIEVGKETWENIKYTLNEDKALEEQIIGSFTQFPIKTAWAITIHKSQGLTFERAIIDAASSFAHGQVYVALSRCKTFEGLILSTPISPDSVKSDNKINDFNEQAEQQDLSESTLNQAKKQTQIEFIKELFDFQQIRRSLGFTSKTVEPLQRHFAIGIFQKLIAINQSFDQEIGGITEKFSAQLEAYFQEEELPEQNQILQERIKKGTIFLLQKLNDLVFEPLKNIDFDSDNKEIKSTVDKSVDICAKTIFEKLQLLKISQTGFESTNYMQTKANASIDYEFDKVNRKTKKENKKGVKSNNTGEAALFELIKDWRDETADEQGVERYMVLPQKTMKSISQEMPGNKAALAQINGMGKVKIEQFGEEILEIINEFCEENGLIANIVEKGKKVEKTIEKGSTFETTLNLHKEGNSIEEIAQIRAMAFGTIESHLTRYISRGELSVENVMDIEKINTIKDYMQANPTFKTTELKLALGDNFSYGEIRMVWSSMNTEN
jgi:PIF1-like helicase/HRDC domain/Helix-turn-helix domain